jgi:hypothetical protein
LSQVARNTTEYAAYFNGDLLAKKNVFKMGWNRDILPRGGQK